VSIGIVGEGLEFTVFDEAETGVYLSGIEGEERGRGPPPAPAPSQSERAPQAPPKGEGPEDPGVAVAMDTE